jgi:hypothetical protein
MGTRPRRIMGRFLALNQMLKITRILFDALRCHVSVGAADSTPPAADQTAAPQKVEIHENRYVSLGGPVGY